MTEGDTRIELSTILKIILIILLFSLLSVGLYRYLRGIWGGI